MDLEKLKKLARRIAGRDVEVRAGAGAYTDGSSIMVLDPDSRWPRLPRRAKAEMEEFLLAHEASHLVFFDRAAKKLGKPSLSGEEMCRIFADPLSPGADSKNYVRFLLNIVEDRLVDEHASGFVNQGVRESVNRFFVWNRQSGVRASLAELESGGSAGKCAAFVEAIFQLEIYGELIESFYSPALGQAAKEATKAIASYGQGSFSRMQALQKVLDALRKYCPPPWRLPPQYKPPKGEGAGRGGDPSQPPQESGGGGEQGGDSSSDSSGQGDGGGESKPGQSQSGGGKSSGSSGDNAGQQGQSQGQAGNGQNSQEEGKGGDSNQSQNADSKNSGKSSSDGNEGGDSSKSQDKGESRESSEGASSEDSKADADEKSAEAKESEGEDDPEAGGEFEGGGNGSPSGSNTRGAETGGEAGAPQVVDRAPERRFEDNNLEALLRMLERVLSERVKQVGRGMPRFRTYSPGDILQSPEEIVRWQEDDLYGTDPLKRRAVRKRDREEHLLAVFIDSSGSVKNSLFSQLYRVMGELAEKIAESQGVKLGVGQFSGGASWVLSPTRDVQEIRDFAEEKPKRLYSGGTTVGEIYGLLPDDFAGFESADLIVLTDGYVEDGKELASSLEASHEETGCEIKLHGVVFRGQGTLKQFVRAKDELQEFVRTWHLGDEQ